MLMRSNDDYNKLIGDSFQTLHYNCKMLLKFFEFTFNCRSWIFYVDNVIYVFPKIVIGYMIVWSSNLQKFNKIFQTKLPLNILARNSVVSFQLKNFRSFMKIIGVIFQLVPFWKKRLLFYLIKHYFSTVIPLQVEKSGIIGVKFRFKGKINVAGNSRTRAINYKTGFTSFSKKENRIQEFRSEVYSFTGVMNFKLWIVF